MAIHKFSVQEATNQIAQRKMIRVTPTLDTSAYSTGDVLFDATEIPNAVLTAGGCSKLIAVTILNEDDVTADQDIIFMQVQTNLGTVNAAVASGSLWTNALAKAAKVLGWFAVDMSDGETDLVNNRIYSTTRSDASGNQGFQPMLLQAEPGSTSVYFSAVSRSGSPTTAADDYEYIFHIEY